MLLWDLGARAGCEMVLEGYTAILNLSCGRSGSTWGKRALRVVVFLEDSVSRRGDADACAWFRRETGVIAVDSGEALAAADAAIAADAATAGAAVTAAAAVAVAAVETATRRSGCPAPSSAAW